MSENTSTQKTYQIKTIAVQNIVILQPTWKQYFYLSNDDGTYLLFEKSSNNQKTTVEEAKGYLYSSEITKKGKLIYEIAM